jgi:hypothetical protein
MWEFVSLLVAFFVVVAIVRFFEWFFSGWVEHKENLDRGLQRHVIWLPEHVEEMLRVEKSYLRFRDKDAVVASALAVYSHMLEAERHGFHTLLVSSGEAASGEIPAGEAVRIYLRPDLTCEKTGLDCYPALTLYQEEEYDSDEDA